MRMIGINVPFVEGRLQEQLAEACRSRGFEARFYTHESLAQKGAADCEVFFGMMPADMIKSCRALKWFHCSFAGVENYCDDALFPSPDVMLTNSAGAYGTTISEHLICTLLMMMRRMPHYHEQQKVRSWNRDGIMRSIYGSTVTVVGMGDIGSNFARKVKAMGAAQVRGVRRNADKPAPEGFDKVYAVADIDAALAGSDVLALCLPATGETRNLIDERRLGLLAEDAYVLNVGRASALDQAGLKRVLDSGRLGGAALDVTQPEPLPPSDPLWDAPRLIITPHVSGNMSLSHTCDRLLEMFLENLDRYAAGQPLRYVVDRKAGY